MDFQIRVKWLLSLALLTVFWISTDASLATMSIDLGSQFIKAGIVKSGVPMEIILNKESKRKSPNAVFLRNGERLFSDAALGMQIRYPSSVYTHFLDLVGKPFDHPSVKNYRKNFPNIDIQKSDNSSAVVFKIDDKLYSVETMLAMVLSHVRDFAQAHAEQPIHDVVITVPAYFTQAERIVVEQAAGIAGFNLLQLINDGSAAALSHGVFRRKEITEKPQRLLVYDVGAAKTTATLVEYRTVKRDKSTEPEMFVLGVGFDRTLGGFELTLRLRDHLANKFNEAYKPKQKIQVFKNSSKLKKNLFQENQRSMAKLLKEAERVKQVLSANTDTLVQIERVHEDKDMRIKLTRDEFSKLYEDLDSRFTEPITQALKIGQLSLEEVDQIVFMGGGSRIPKIQEIVQDFVKPKTIGKFLNTDEAIAMGALFQSAHLSKGFKVKPFQLNELILFPVEVDFVSKNTNEAGESVEKNLSRAIFRFRNNYPTNKKSLSLTSYTSDFTITWKFGDLAHFSEKQLEEFGELVKPAQITVTGLAKALEENLKEDSDYKGVKIGFQLDPSGIVRIGKAELNIEKKKGVIGCNLKFL
ncbi:hypothetical protein WR25_22607 isoform B [Diploscapter pachys]|uniref:Uncharacterized protein n=1 Tax=Diploscapter pachys TaxID=2018661 RepID=A0A2A2JNR0_9BILA|nr:hypothetical protein WR25_22607 isoform B [Diploscapter pachys]